MSELELPTSRPVHLGENGYVESFAARFRDDLLNGEIVYSLREAEIIINELASPSQCDQTPCLTRVSPASPGGRGVDLHRLAGCADPTCFAGQATRGSTAYGALTLIPDHPVGTEHGAPRRPSSDAYIELTLAV